MNATVVQRFGIIHDKFHNKQKMKTTFSIHIQLHVISDHRSNEMSSNEMRSSHIKPGQVIGSSQNCQVNSQMLVDVVTTSTGDKVGL